MQLFYSEDLVKENQLIILDGQESIHISKVLRKKIGDIIHVTNGKGLLFEAEILSLNKKGCNLEAKKLLETKEFYSNLTVAIAPTKNLARLEWFIEKSVEIGIEKICLFISSNSERREVKADRLQLKALSAMKQSLKFVLPEVTEAFKFKSAIDIAAKGNYETKLIAYCGENAIKIMPELDFNKKSIIFIGPEGGFSENEIEYAKQNGFKAVSLGSSRLRTETAGLFVTSIYNSLNL